jgi:hypothetical protein
MAIGLEVRGGELKGVSKGLTLTGRRWVSKSTGEKGMREREGRNRMGGREARGEKEDECKCVPVIDAC